MNTLLSNACLGKSASRNGLNMDDFRAALKVAYPYAIPSIDAAVGRKDLEDLCKKLAGQATTQPITQPVTPTRQEPTPPIRPAPTPPIRPAIKVPLDSTLKQLPKEYCEDYTLEELNRIAIDQLQGNLMEKTGNNVKLTSADRENVCRILNLPTYPVNMAESLGYSRETMLRISAKIDKKEPLTPEDERVVKQWNRNHDPLKERLDELAKKFVVGEQLSETEMSILDRELFNKYCRCVLKRKAQDKELISSRDLDRILARLNEEGRQKAKEIVQTESDAIGKPWAALTNVEKDAILVKLLPKFLELTIGGCKSSVYMKSRGIKSRNRQCDYDMNSAEILFESMNK